MTTHHRQVRSTRTTYAREDLDFAVSPREDFYQFATGGWQQRMRQEYGDVWLNAFDLVGIENRRQLKAAFRAATENSSLEPESDIGKAVAMYCQGRDRDTRNAAGVTPVQEIIDQILSISSPSDAYAFQAIATRCGMAGLLPAFVAYDRIDPTLVGVYVTSPRLGLVIPDYYLDHDDEDDQALDHYAERVERNLTAVGISADIARTAASDLIAFETAIADVISPLDTQEYGFGATRAVTLEQLETRHPFMDWQAWAEDLGIHHARGVFLYDPGFLDHIDGILRAAPISAVHAYFLQQLFVEYADALSDEIESNESRFLEKLHGVPITDNPDARVFNSVAQAFPAVLGRLYVETSSQAPAKAEVIEMCAWIRDAFRRRIERNSWLSPKGRALALMKLETISFQVGFPDDNQWQSYGDVDIGATFGETTLNARIAAGRRSFATAGLPRDIFKWNEVLHDPQARYDPAANVIFVSAGMLGGVRMVGDGDPACNFGGIATVIAHEMAHALDLARSPRDYHLIASPWPPHPDKATLLALTSRVIDQYDAIDVRGPLYTYPEESVTENVVDLTSVAVAFDAMNDYLAAHPEHESSPSLLPTAQGDAMQLLLPGFAFDLDNATPAQRFFLAYANSWRTTEPDSSHTLNHTIRRHAPYVARVLQPLRNCDAFHDAFGIREGDPMWIDPADRITIW